MGSMTVEGILKLEVNYSVEVGGSYFVRQISSFFFPSCKISVRPFHCYYLVVVSSLFEALPDVNVAPGHRENLPWNHSLRFPLRISVYDHPPAAMD